MANYQEISPLGGLFREKSFVNGARRSLDVGVVNRYGPLREKIRGNYAGFSVYPNLVSDDVRDDFELLFRPLLLRQPVWLSRGQKPGWYLVGEPNVKFDLGNGYWAKRNVQFVCGNRNNRVPYSAMLPIVEVSQQGQDSSLFEKLRSFTHYKVLTDEWETSMARKSERMFDNKEKMEEGGADKVLLKKALGEGFRIIEQYYNVLKRGEKNMSDFFSFMERMAKWGLMITAETAWISFLKSVESNANSNNWNLPLNITSDTATTDGYFFNGIPGVKKIALMRRYGGNGR